MLLVSLDVKINSITDLVEDDSSVAVCENRAFLEIVVVGVTVEGGLRVLLGVVFM